MYIESILNTLDKQVKSKDLYELSDLIKNQKFVYQKYINKYLGLLL